jgi:phosphoribosylformimino-5-aminoimidazole carboxamide ribotide isomerase
MKIYPAIDILDGKCVRLFQGRLDKPKVYYDDPLDAAIYFQENGVKRIHVVDLNGAVEGKVKNWEALERIILYTQLEIQFGGGVRTMLTVEKLFNAGVSRVVLGTSVVDAPELLAEASQKFGEQIVAAIDVKGENVSVKGWREKTELKPKELVKELEMIGIKTIIYTDISVDGTLRGVNVSGIKKLLEETEIKVIASGGIKDLNDIVKLKQLEPLGLEGAIIGKAIYEKTIDIREALKIAGDAE